MNRNAWGIAGVALAVSLCLAFFLSPYASRAPDGLEHVMEAKAPAPMPDAGEAKPPVPLPDYSTPGMKSEALSTGIAGIAGTAGAFVILVAIMYLLRRLRGRNDGKA